MKLSHSLFYLLAGIIGVYLGYSLLPITDALLFNNLETGDLATWFAASGTILTLGFLINQHTQLRAEQRKEKEERKIEEAKQRKELAEERKKREEHEQKQQEMWASQEKMFTFQKYQNHKSLLLELLRELESQHSVTFSDKSKFYRKIFIKNNSEYCDVKISLRSLDFGFSQLGLLEIIYQDLKKHFLNFKDMQLSPVASLEADITGKIFDQYLTKLYQFSQALHVDLNMPAAIGNVHLLDKPNSSISNIFVTERSFKTLEAIYISISHFCGNELKEFKDLSSTGLSLAKIYHLFDNAHHHYFESQLTGLEDELNLLWEYLLLLSHDDIVESTESDRDIIITFFNDSENYGLCEKNLAHLPTVLQTLYESNKDTQLDNGLIELNQRCKNSLVEFGVNL
jgi:hypothetical protein